MVLYASFFRLFVVFNIQAICLRLGYFMLYLVNSAQRTRTWCFSARRPSVPIGCDIPTLRASVSPPVYSSKIITYLLTESDALSTCRHADLHSQISWTAHDIKITDNESPTTLSSYRQFQVDNAAAVGESTVYSRKGELCQLQNYVIPTHMSHDESTILLAPFIRSQ